MPKILHTSRYTGLPLQILKDATPEGFSVETLTTPSKDALINQVKDADYLLVSGRLPIDEEVLRNTPNLKMIQRTGVGTEMLDLEAIKRHNIPVYVNKGINARSVAEHTLTLIFSSLKNIPFISKNVKQGVWKKQETGLSTHELYDKVVGLVGMGAIGQLVARYLKCFGARIMYTDIKPLSKEIEKELEAVYIPSFEKMLPFIDILSFHCPHTPENEKMLNRETLALMKNGVIIINTARGKLIDENALYDGLISGKVKCAGLDVHYEEPLKKDSPLLKLDNVILTPHIAGLSNETFKQMLKDSVDNIVKYHNGEYKLIENKKLI